MSETRGLAEVQAPSQDDRFVAGASRLLGGEWGRHAVNKTFAWSAVLSIMLVAAFVSLLAYAQKSPCRTHVWSNDYQYTRYCYTDISGLYYDEHLNTLNVPYTNELAGTGQQGTKYLEYPTFTGWFMYGAAELAHTIVRPNPQEKLDLAQGGTLAADATYTVQARQATAYFDISAIGLGLAGIAMVGITALCAGRRRIWDALLVATAPTFVLYLFVNWDVLAALTVVGSLYLWSRGRYLLAGVVVAAGVSFKLYPILVLLALAICGLRQRWWKQLAQIIGSTVVSWLVFNLPVWLVHPTGFRYFWSFNQSRGADFDSWSYAWQHYFFNGSAWHVGSLNAAVAVLDFAGIAAIIYVVLYAVRPPKVSQVLLLVAAVFLLANKVYSPQYVIFLLPIVALARPRWPTFLLWQASEIMLFFLRYPFLISIGNPTEGVPYSLYFFLGVLPRDIMVVVLVAQTVNDMWHGRTGRATQEVWSDPLEPPLAPQLLGAHARHASLV